MLRGADGYPSSEMVRWLAVAISLISLAGCQAALPQGPMFGDGGLDAVSDVQQDVHVDLGPPPDPFEAQPDVSEGLTNTSHELAQVLEEGALRGACALYAQEPTRHNRLLCGKSMFFYQAFGTTGIPRTLFEWFPDHLPQSVGNAYTRFGLVQDPYSNRDYPLGIADGRQDGRNATVAFTCASCHFGRTPDGRYSVGYPNYQFDYGKMLLTLMVAPMAAAGNSQFLPGRPSAMAQERLADVLTELNAGGSTTRNSLLAALGAIVIGGSRPVTFAEADQDFHAAWRTGTMDFFISPTAFDDGVGVVSKIAPLWSIATPDELSRHGLHHAMLGSAGSASSVLSFCQSFVELGGGDVSMWSVEAIGPLVDYIYSLRAPAPEQVADPNVVAAGRTLFDEQGCLSCHNGPRGGGTRLYDFEDIGVDDVLRNWTDPEQTGTSCCGITFPEGDGPTGRIRVPRLVGVNTMNRFLHNGSVDSLESLLCLNETRPQVADAPGFEDGGHLYGCAELSDEEKRALITFLRSL